jgi:hypothetical protein
MGPKVTADDLEDHEDEEGDAVLPVPGGRQWNRDHNPRYNYEIV